MPDPEPSGSTRSWNEPVAPRVIELPVSRSVKVVSISLPSMWPRTGKLHWSLMSLSSGAGMISRVGLAAIAVGATASAVRTAIVSATRATGLPYLRTFIAHLLLGFDLRADLVIRQGAACRTRAHGTIPRAGRRRLREGNSF